MIAALIALLAVVNSPVNSVTYTCDVGTAVYTVNFPYLASSDLVVTTATAAGAVTTLTPGTDWTTNLSATSSTAALTLNSPATKCLGQSTLKIARSMSLTQPTSFKQQNNYSPSVHEQAFDRAAMLAQQNSTLAVSGDLVGNLPAPRLATSGVAAGTYGNATNVPVITLDAKGRATTASMTPVFTTGTSTTYTAPYVGAVARSPAGKFAETISPCDFEQPCPSLTDDTVALQTAITAAKATGAWVVIPAGTFSVNAELSVGGQFRMRGPGTITSSVSTAAILVANADLTDFVVRDLKLTTTRNNLVLEAAALFYSDGFNMDGGLIDNVRFDTASSFSNGLLFAAQIGKTLKNVTIRNCVFVGTSGSLELLNHADTVTRLTQFAIVGNKFFNTNLIDDQLAGFAISLSGLHNGFTVSQNEITGYPYAGIEVVIPPFAAGSFIFDYKIHGNTLTNTGRGIITDATHTTDRMSRVSIVGNTITGSRFFQRFEHLSYSEIANNHVELVSGVTSTDRLAEFVSFRNSDHVAVTGNNINLDLPAAENTKAVVSFVNWSNGEFSNNMVRTTGLQTLRFDGTTTTVSNNTVAGNKLVYAPNGGIDSPVAFQGTGSILNFLNGNTLETSVSNTIASSATGSNLARGTTVLRTDTGVVSTNDLLVVTVAGATDLSFTPELRFVRLIGAPGAPFTLKLPSRDGLFTVSNQTGQTATINATAGSVTLLTGNTTTVTVQSGTVAAY